MSNPAVKEALSWIKILVAAVCFALIINNFVIVNATVPTGSMMDTIPEKSRIVAFRLSYLFSDPKRLDVVVFKYPDNEKELYVKRIIGMPGDKVEIIDGKVFINNSVDPLPDGFVRGLPLGSYGPYYVPEGCYFMMGDNRNNSEDSRFWIHTFLERSKILGKAVVCYYPEIKLIE